MVKSILKIEVTNLRFRGVKLITISVLIKPTQVTIAFPSPTINVAAVWPEAAIL